MSVAALETLHDLRKHQELLIATTRVELTKRYAGSILGVLWVIINPLLFLGVYLFLYLVIFKIRLPEMSELGFAVFVFAGLVPYMAFMEVANSSGQVIRANIGLIKNLIFPITLIPVRVTTIAMLTQFVGLGMVIGLAIANSDFAWSRIALLLVVLVLQFLFLTGVSFIISALGVMLQDFNYFLNSLLLFMLFITPIGFQPALVPSQLYPIVALNPFHYMTDAFRSALMYSHGINFNSIAIFAMIALTTFVIGAAFFRRFRLHLVDYE